MKTLEEIKNILREQKNGLKERYGVKEIGIFGSFARGEQKKISDVDILVEFERPIGLKFFELADYIEEILGIKIDLLTPNALKQKPLLWQSAAEDLIYV
ncbi:MAG: nucleotidyltransferase family protein [Methanobacteriaceae archaeon]|jgi:predicted nucleotidyltransferase